MPSQNQAAPLCAVPAAVIPHSNGPCGEPVRDCLRNPGQEALPQLGRNRYNDPPTASERSFYERYMAHGGGDKKKSSSKTSTKRQASSTKRQASKNRQRRQSRTRRRGGGYFLDLTACPPGGIPSVVSYPDV